MDLAPAVPWIICSTDTALKELAAVFGRVEMELLASSLRVASSFVESILRHQALRDPEN